MAHPNKTVPVTADKPALSLTTSFCLVSILTFICFIPDLKNGLLDWDDFGYINENVQIRSLSFETVRWAFSEFYCNYWAPLTWLSLALDYAVWGLNPVGYHLTNNLFHALNAGMFFLVSYQLLQQYCHIRHTENTHATILNSTNILYCSLLAALLFAIHPLRVESVAWATERKDVLSMFFGILAVLAYLRHTQRLNRRTEALTLGVTFSSISYWLMVAFYILSLCSKAMLITLPVLLLVMDWFPLKRITNKYFALIILEKIPLLILAGLASTITMNAMAVSSKSLSEIDLLTRILTAFKSLTDYLWLMIWPVNISPAYLHPGNISQIGFKYIFPVFVFFAISLYCVASVKKQPVFLAVWLLFLIALFPVLGITQNGPQVMAARFMYLPGMPVALLAALGVTAIMARCPPAIPGMLTTFRVTVAVLLVCYVLISVRDIGFWKDDVTLWSRVIELKPKAVGKPYTQRALAYEAKGEYKKALDDINVAFSIAESKKYRGLHEIHAVRARILKGLGELDKAIAEYNKAIELAVPVPRYYFMERGVLFKMRGMLERANEDFRSAESRQ